MDARMKNLVRPDSDSLDDLHGQLLVCTRLQSMDGLVIEQHFYHWWWVDWTPVNCLISEIPSSVSELDPLVSFSSLYEHNLARSGC
jgi:hypothetical protein